MSRWTAPRIMTMVAVLTMVASAVAFVVTLILNTFVLDEYDAYGQVAIPGSTSLHLPAGDVTVTFHTVLIGSTTGSGLPVPPLKYRIGAPKGVAQPRLTEDYGTTTTVNNDARIRIGYLHVETEGTYDIETDGNVSAYLTPSLAFGHGSRYGYLPYVFGGVFGAGLVLLVIARLWASHDGKREPSLVGYQQPPLANFGVTPTWTTGDGPSPPMPAGSFTPSDEGIRIQSLNTLARLRDSGALTEVEYDAEKKRVLDGP